MEEATAAGAIDELEAGLVERAKRRTPSAWAELYDRYYAKLYRYCYARTADPDAAADLASRVFLEALEGIDGYTHRGRPILAWLYRIARNLVSDYHRARRREAAAYERQAAEGANQDAGGNAFAQVADRHDLLLAMRQLTEDQQQVVALRYYAGLTTAELAEAMGRSERAVYSLEVRALGSLRRLLSAPPSRGTGRKVA